MNFVRTLGVLLLSTLSLTACLEVEDNSNKDVAAALEEQNRLLQEQAQSSAQAQKISIVVTASVKNLETNALVSDATASLKIGSTISKTVEITNGSFTVTDLPASSDYELVIHSKSNAFLDRTFFGQTKAASVSGVAYQDLGLLTVSPGIERAFKVLDDQSGNPISSLVFVASSNVGQGANSQVYWHKSSYDAVAGQYKIIVPEFIDVQLSASLDVDNDGVYDYQGSSSSARLTIASSQLSDPQIFLLQNITSLDTEKRNVQVRLSVLNNVNSPVPGLSLVVADELNGVIKSTFDETTKQYVLDLVIKSDLAIKVPSFDVLSDKYSASVVRVNYRGGNRYSVYSDNLYTADLSFADNEPHVLNAITKPYIQRDPIVSLMTSAIKMNPLDFELGLYFSSAISLAPKAVELVRTDAVNVVPGNALADDTVLPGTTMIYTEQQIDITQELSLGNTFLRASPTAPLAAGRYQYRLSQITSQPSGVIQSLNYRSSETTVSPASAEFLMSDVRLDNNNYLAQHSLIKTQNTAGAPVSVAWGGYSDVSVYLPLSLVNVKNLTMSKRSVVENNITQAETGNYPIVIDGVINANQVSTVSIAQNENVVFRPNGYISGLARGTTLSDGSWYSIYVGEYLQDSRSGSVNSITFDYALETKSGRVETGVITLQVL